MRAQGEIVRQMKKEGRPKEEVSSNFAQVNSTTKVMRLSMLRPPSGARYGAGIRVKCPTTMGQC